MSSTPPRRPILIGPDYAKNLERGQGGVWLNGIPEKLLSRLSVCSGACAPSLVFIMFIAEVRFACHIVLRGRADGMLSGAALRGSSTTLLQLSPAPPFLSTTYWHVLRNLPA